MIMMINVNNQIIAPFKTYYEHSHLRNYNSYRLSDNKRDICYRMPYHILLDIDDTGQVGYVS